MNYLAYTLLDRSRSFAGRRGPTGSKAYYASAFQQVYGMPLEQAWRDWIAFEQDVPAHEHRGHPEVSDDAVQRRVTRGARFAVARVRGSRTPDDLRRAELPRHPRLHRRDRPGRWARRSIRTTSSSRASTPSRRWPSTRRRTRCSTPPTTRAYRDLMALDPATRRQRTLLKDARIGDLSFNRADESLWGIRTFNGICTLVRIPAPYTDWNAGLFVALRRDRVRPRRLAGRPAGVGSVGEINGKQGVARHDDRALAGRRCDAGQRSSTSAPPSRRTSCSRPTAVPLRQLVLHRRLEHLPLRARDRRDGGADQRETGFFRPTCRSTTARCWCSATPARASCPLDRIASARSRTSAPISFLGHESSRSSRFSRPGPPGRRPMCRSNRCRAEGAATGRSDGCTSSRSIRRRGLQERRRRRVHARFSDPRRLQSPDVQRSVFAGRRRSTTASACTCARNIERYDWTRRAALNDSRLLRPVRSDEGEPQGYALSLGHLNYLVFDEPRR